MAHLNNAPLNRIILELPPTVAFAPGEYGTAYYRSLLIDERVTVLEAEETPDQEEKAAFEDGAEVAESEETALLEVSSEVAPAL
ncbi:hypothetical protein DSECCO2_461130 [anaerobic digester metagenome]